MCKRGVQKGVSLGCEKKKRFQRDLVFFSHYDTLNYTAQRTRRGFHIEGIFFYV